MSDFGTRPERVTLTNADDGDFITAQFNPEEVKEKLSARFNDLAIMGLSHEPDQYKNTGNLALTFELGFDALSFDGGIDTLERARRFLHSFFYSRRGSQDVIGGGPARLILTWPNLYELRCTFRELEITHSRFTRAMNPVLFKANVTLQESRTRRLYAEDVLQNGTIRRS
jgi:hypothetical protein